MYLARNIEEYKSFIKELVPKYGSEIGFVPTMGALHRGHQQLINRCNKENDITVATVFVNPEQFNNPKDLENYPIQTEEDFKILQEAGCHIMFAPQVADIYPDGADSSDIELDGLDKIIEGKYRPGHFKGVALVIDRFIKIIGPTRAYFGTKDYQQVVVVRKLVEQRPYDVDIVACDTVRDENGLAMSSRNKLLDAEQKNEAAVIYKMLQSLKSHSQNKTINELLEMGQSIIYQSSLDLEYLIFIDGKTFEEVENMNQHQHVVLCTAAFLNGVRLIDNIEIKS